MMARTSSSITQSLAEIEQRTSVWGDKVWCFLVFLTLKPFDGVGNVVSYFNKTFGFSNPILTMFAAFIGEENLFFNDEQISKIVATISARMPEIIFKIWENDCKVFVHHFDYLWARWKTCSNKNTCIVDEHPYKNILLPRYRAPQKTVKFVEVVPKRKVPPFVLTEILLNHAILKMFWGLFI